MGRMSKEEEKTIVGDIIAAQHEFNTLKEERGGCRKGTWDEKKDFSVL